MPQELREQVPVIQEVLAAMDIEIVTKEGYEADDMHYYKKTSKNRIDFEKQKGVDYHDQNRYYLRILRSRKNNFYQKDD